GGEVLIVDEFTGRTMPGRRWSDGLHQAIEVKEGVQVQQENQTLASITFQNYFRLYKKLAGMTGTADTEAVEFKKIYNLDVVVIPTNRPMVRNDHADVVYSTERGKYNAAVQEIASLHEKGQPVLVGTASIEKSELVSTLLRRKGVPHEVLNAKHHEKEAFIVAQAGRLGAVTISTNMAGRGTDIVLGGNPEFLAAEELGVMDAENPEFQQALARYEESCKVERERVLEAGGLFVLGTERHESRRIDNQLRGRSGRQGDPGGSRFYVSLEDELMRRFGGERMQAIMTRVGLREDEAIEGALVARAIENAQKRIEGFHFDARKHILEYDDVLNKQRSGIYAKRAQILNGENVGDAIKEMVPDEIELLITERADERTPVSRWNVKGMFDEFFKVFGIRLATDEYVAAQEDRDRTLAQEIFDVMRDAAFAKLEQQQELFGAERFQELSRHVLLSAINEFWKIHLTEMDHLREGIGLRGYAQKNPLHEYQREAFFLFQETLSNINRYTLNQLFNARPITEEEMQRLHEEMLERQRAVEAAAVASHEEVLEGREDGGKSAQVPGDGNRR
ncbi:MAG: preprotein translocase subunit SecA, partial [Bdellovibrionales bacterium]|nr:preprotein translocase subunit SecA [Bdellovibrionales bacterium]